MTRIGRLRVNIAPPPSSFADATGELSVMPALATTTLLYTGDAVPTSASSTPTEDARSTSEVVHEEQSSVEQSLESNLEKGSAVPIEETEVPSSPMAVVEDGDGVSDEAAAPHDDEFDEFTSPIETEPATENPTDRQHNEELATNSAVEETLVEVNAQQSVTHTATVQPPSPPPSDAVDVKVALDPGKNSVDSSIPANGAHSASTPVLVASDSVKANDSIEPNGNSNSMPVVVDSHSSALATQSDPVATAQTSDAESTLSLSESSKLSPLSQDSSRLPSIEALAKAQSSTDDIIVDEEDDEDEP
jgi:hypothetical protein